MIATRTRQAEHRRAPNGRVARRERNVETLPDASVRSTAGGDLLDGLWSLFSSTKLALLLILGIAAACLAGALIAQMPSEMLKNPEAMRTWAERMRPRYGGLTDLFQTVGLFSVFQTVWFRALLGLLAINMVVCTMNRLPAIWQQVFGAPSWPRDGLFERGEPREVVMLPLTSSEVGRETLRRTLSRLHYRVTEHPELGGSLLYADRFRLARFGTLFTHTALVLVLAGAVLSGPLGYFEESGFSVPVGATREVGHGTSLAVRVEDFADEYYPDGRPSDYRSEAVVLDQGREVARQTIRVNEPLVYDGVRFHQAFFGQSAVLTVSDGTGKTIFRDPVALTWRSNDGQRPVGYFFLPSRDLQVYLVGTAGKGDPLIRSGEIVVEAYRGAAKVPTFRATLTQRQPQTVGDVSFTFEREIPFAGLRVVRDPGAALIWLACVLLLAGLVATFYFPHQRLWARLLPAPGGQQVVVAGAGRGMAGPLQAIARQLRPEGDEGPVPMPPNEPTLAGQLERPEPLTVGQTNGQVKSGQNGKTDSRELAGGRAPRGSRRGR